jgi:adenylate kinase
VYIIFLGAPGAGKGTQAAYVAQKLNLFHLAVGDLLRQEIERGTELGMKAKSYMKKGVLAPDSVVIPMVLQRMSAPEGEHGVILDGFPRNLKQAETLDQALGRESKAIDKVVCIKVSEEELMRRLSGRLVCRSCQVPYHMASSPPQVEGSCDKCGSELYQRDDDTAGAVEKRLKVYSVETAPLIDYYSRTGKLLTIDGEGDVGEVGERIVTALCGENL